MRLVFPRYELWMCFVAFLMATGFASSPFLQWRGGRTGTNFAGEVFIALLMTCVAVGLSLHHLLKEHSWALGKERRMFKAEVKMGDGLLIGPFQGLHRKSLVLDLNNQFSVSANELLGLRSKLKSCLVDPKVEYQIRLLGRRGDDYYEVSKRKATKWIRKVNSYPDDGTNSTAAFWEEKIDTEYDEYFLQIRVVGVTVSGFSEEQGQKLPEAQLKLTGRVLVGMKTMDLRSAVAVSARSANVQVLKVD